MLHNFFIHQRMHGSIDAAKLIAEKFVDSFPESQSWEYNFDPQTNVIDVHVSRLRQKIDKDFDKPLLSTIRGAGYMLNDS